MLGGVCVGRSLSSCEVSDPLRVAESTRFSFVSGAPVAGTCPQVLLFHFSNIQHPMHLVSAFRVWISRAGCLAVLGFHSLPILTPFFLPGSGVGEHSGPAWPWPVSYPLHVMLSSHRCRCILAVVLHPLVSLLGIVVFIVFS